MAAGKLLADRALERGEPDDSGHGGKRGEQRHVGHGSSDVLQGKVGRWDRVNAILLKSLRESAEAHLVEALRRVDENDSSRGKTIEQVDLMQERRVLDDQRIGLEHRLRAGEFPCRRCGRTP
jgi:hypothetical protein